MVDDPPERTRGSEHYVLRMTDLIVFDRNLTNIESLLPYNDLTTTTRLPSNKTLDTSVGRHLAGRILVAN